MSSTQSDNCAPFVHVLDIIFLFAAELEEPKIEIYGKGLSSRPTMSYSFPKQALVFTCLQYKSFENTVGKEEIARDEQFLLFPQCFLSFQRTFPPFSSNFELSSANFFGLEESKIRRLGKG